jgi:hypothetical protein
VLHDFYSAGRWTNVKIVPLPETVTLLQQLGCIIRQVDNELLIIARTDGNGKMLRDISSFEKFSFAIVPQTPNYLNFTNYPLSKLNNTVFYFHNLNENEFEGKRYISKSIENYTNTNDYTPGDFAKLPAATGIYESIRINNKGAGSIAPDNSLPEPAINFWALLENKQQYASKNDTFYTFAGTKYPIVMAGKIINTKAAAPEKNHTVNVFTFNSITRQHDKEVIAETINYNEDRDDIQVNVNRLPSGLYRLKVGDDNSFFFIDTSNERKQGNMYIDIYNLPDTHPQAMLSATGEIKKMRFSVAFAARRTLWKYKTRTTAVSEIKDTDNKYPFAADGSKQFISLRPIPFANKAILLEARNGSSEVLSLLPNPPADRLSAEQTGVYTTEIFINY